MELIDWIIFSVVFIAIASVTWVSKKYLTSVADFLAANRCAGRYLLCISQGLAATGAVGIIGQFQMIYSTGFASGWWYYFAVPLTFFITLSGWIVYRYRQTRAMTVGQLFEIRYSREFRIFAGFLAFFAGIINFGIWPAIGADFFMAYCEIPDQIGGIPSYPLLLAVLIGVSAYFTLIGGQISVIISNFIQGMYFNLIMLALMIVVLVRFDMESLFKVLVNSPSGQSMVNPMDLAGNQGYTIWFFVINTFIQIYGYKCWQSDSGFNCSARNAHEAKMAGVLGAYRHWGFLISLTVLPLCAYMIMNDAAFSRQAAAVNETLSSIDNAEIRSQLITPVAMKVFVPHGLLGAFAVTILIAFIASVGTQLHAWGSILIQDAILPLKRKALTPQAHIRWLRISIVGVAVFIFLWSLFFRQTQRMQLFFLVTGAIYISGAGSVIIGGLYWKKGTTAAAWSSMIAGAVISMGGMILEQLWSYRYGKSFPLDYKWISLIGIGLSCAIYVIVSLLQNRPSFNLDKMLHRGIYSVENESVSQPPKWSIKSVMGITGEFSLADKLVYAYAYAWSWFICGLSIVVTLVALVWGISNETWGKIHYYLLIYLLMIALLIAAWLTYGGYRDFIQMLRDLKSRKQNNEDDGRVDSVPLELDRAESKR